jgi:hypothetical protein
MTIIKKSFFRYFILLATLLLSGLSAGAYTMPLGIPEPPFGINETHEMYAGQYYEAGGFDYKDAGNGPYTHYIDNTDPNATDTDNPYGDPSKPRMTFPLTMPAGSVIEIHGTGYTTSIDRFKLVTEGTEALPVFMRGYSADASIIINKKTHVSGEYLIIENLHFYDASLVIPHMQNSYPYHAAYICVRNNEIEGTGEFKSGGGLLIKSVSDEEIAENIVVYNNEIHHCGQHDSTSENDSHAVSLGMNVKYFWMLNNHVHHNGGDSFQVKYASESPNLIPQYIYIGGNDMHDDAENAVDLKGSLDVVVSENKMYNYDGYTDTTEMGVVFVAHSGPSTYPENVWVINNDIHDAKLAGCRVTSGDEIYFVGNRVYNITNPTTGEAAAFGSWNSAEQYIVNNTITNSDIGIDYSGVDNTVVIENNIFSELNSDAYIVLSNSVYLANAVLENNLFYHSTLTPSIDGNDTSSLFTAPLFSSEENDDFTLSASSPARDAGKLSAVYQTFFDTYGLDISSDAAEITRPQADSWDIGAYEYIDAGSDSTLSLQVNQGTGDGDYEAGSVASITAYDASDGQEFDAWTGDIEYLTDPTSASTTLTMPNTDVVLTATYRDTVQYSLIVNSGSGSGDYESDTVVEIVAETAPDGQEFDIWTGDVANVTNLTSASTFITIEDEAVTVTATYKDIVTYSLTVNNGSGSGDYEAGTVVSITAEDASDGQVFNSWSGDTTNLDNANSATTTITMDADATVTATYQDEGEVLYGLVVNNGSGDGDYVSGSSVTIIADDASDGQEFDAWTGDTTALANTTSATTTVTMPESSVTVTATYKDEVVDDSPIIAERVSDSNEIDLAGREFWVFNQSDEDDDDVNVHGNLDGATQDIGEPVFTTGYGSLEFSESTDFQFYQDGVSQSNGNRTIKYNEANSCLIPLVGDGQEQTAKLYIKAGVWSYTGTFTITAGENVLEVELPSSNAWIRYEISIKFTDSVDVVIQPNGTYDGYSAFSVAGILLDELTVSTESATDTDTDGIPDEWENSYDLDASDAEDALLDTDQDGISNLDEYIAGTDPTDLQSYLRVDELTHSDESFTFSFQSQAGREYSIDRKYDLQDDEWTPLDTVVSGTGAIIEVEDDATEPAQFYRLNVSVQEE